MYYGWVIEDSVELVIDVDGFVEKLDKVLFGKSDKIKEGYYVVESWSIEWIVYELVSVY